MFGRQTTKYLCNHYDRVFKDLALDYGNHTANRANISWVESIDLEDRVNKSVLGKLVDPMRETKEFFKASSLSWENGPLAIFTSQNKQAYLLCCVFYERIFFVRYNISEYTNFIGRIYFVGEWDG